MTFDFTSEIYNYTLVITEDLKLPLNLHSTETPTCNISKSFGMGKVLQQCKLIIWDECTMAHKKSLEALDQCSKDFRGKSKPFGSTLTLLVGDFR